MTVGCLFFIYMCFYTENLHRTRARRVPQAVDQGWIVSSCASHAASVVFARKPDGSRRQDHRRLNAITQRSVEPLPHVDQLVDETRGGRFFTKLDLGMA